MEASAGSVRVRPEEILQNTLSILSMETAHQPWGEAGRTADKLSTFRAIGAGTCGTVFEIPNSLEVVKRAKTGYEAALWNDHICHRIVLECIGRNSDLFGGGLHVSKSRSFVRANDGHNWRKLAANFPQDYRSRSALYFSERILPVPKSVRSALIDEYFPEEVRSEAKATEANKDCLIRVYLGRRRDPNRLIPTRVSLRNYNLHLDQMEELGLDTKSFAATMARALAVMHWDAGIDTDDVEFVLGSSPTTISHTSHSLFDLAVEQGPISTLKDADVHTKAVSMWLLDFNRCQRIRIHGGKWDLPSDEDERHKGLEMAFDSFFRNDPYYPRPLSSNVHEKMLWQTFCDAYVSTGKTILDGEMSEISELPDRFITMVESRMQLGSGTS
ncbi:hypothetical protein MMC30_002281 [Trapelia coarctata]|nr:hypothetical protein [Trapelia coarctata]